MEKMGSRLSGLLCSPFGVDRPGLVHAALAQHPPGRHEGAHVVLGGYLEGDGAGRVRHLARPDATVEDRLSGDAAHRRRGDHGTALGSVPSADLPAARPTGSTSAGTRRPEASE